MTHNAPVPLSLKVLRLLFRSLSPIMPKMMGRLAYNIWFTPPKTLPHKIEAACADKATARFITVDGQAIRLWSWGEGPTVVFLHGWGGRGTQVSSFIEPLNRMGYQVISFDMPAHGQSEGKKTNGFDMAKVTDAVLASIHDLHAVITHSFGGIILGFCYTQAIHLKKLILFCPPSTIQTVLAQYEQTLQLPSPAKKALIAEMHSRFGTDLFERFSLINNIQKVTQPVLVVHDKQDDVVPFEDGQMVAEAVKNGEFYATNELGHRKILFDNTVVAQVIQFMVEP